MSQQKRHPTAQEVEDEKLRMRNIQAQEDAGQPKEQPQQQQQPAAAPGNGVTKLIFKTQYVNIEITDPNILQELNTVDKYAQNVPFIGLEFNVNKSGGRLAVRSEDRKEVIREILSGVGRKETEAISSFQVERGPNAPTKPVEQ